MVDIALLQSVSYIAGALGVCIAAIFYVLNLSISQKNQELSLRALEQSAQAQQQTLQTRQAQILMSLYQMMSNPEFGEAWKELETWEWKDFNDFQAKYGSGALSSSRWNMIDNFFEGVGVMVKRGFVDAAIVDDLMSYYILYWWRKIESIILDQRKRLNSPTIDEHTEYLYNVVHEIWRQQHPEIPEPQ
jgi:hypothetical protein